MKNPQFFPNTSLTGLRLYKQISLKLPDFPLQFTSDFNGEERFLTRIGVGGLINLEKMHQAHVVLNDIHLFHEHAKNMARKVGGRNFHILNWWYFFCKKKQS